MSNVLKGYYVSLNEDSRVVDVEELVKKRIEEEEERKARLAYILGSQDEGTEGEEFSEADFTEGLFAETIEASNPEDVNQEGLINNQVANEELSLANEELISLQNEIEALKTEADSIIENANAEAERIKEEAYQEAQNRGYEEGYNAGLNEVENLKAEVHRQAEENMLQYETLVKNFEPQMVDIITDIYEKVFDVCLDDYKNIVSALAIDALNHSDGAKNIIIHLSKDDFLRVSENKDQILMQTGLRENDIDFIQDATLSLDECMIETENGVFDCSLKTELAELKRKLMLLSYKRD